MTTLFAILGAALVPTLTGFIWYHPKTFGNAWMKVAGMTEEKIRSSNMALIMILCYICSAAIALMLMAVVIHQSHIYSIFQGVEGAQDPNSEVGRYIADLMAKYGDNFRTFKHGVFHGVLTGILFVTPIITINSLFERRGFKYIAIHAGYWIITLGLMGGVVCQWAMK